MDVVWSPLKPTEKMIIDCKVTMRLPYCDIGTSFVRLLRPQKDYGRNKNAARTPRTPLRRRMVGFGRRKDAVQMQ
ncbi:hypothetical protein DPMN_000831 [Dreissena polymorpha]|uniref:Uncharacterized protein n=1 Tax=Dreissena polymorpha TaxID=45954 RepID=A0A9D4MHE4_DREPO|nr:hypothetical protein DPMN_000831 [Dreissena polymorpha]